MSFKNLKKNSGNSLAALQKQVEEQTAKKDYTDHRFWKPTADAQGNVNATFRFMPPPANEELMYQTYHSHGWQDKGGWYFENCPTSIGKPCPVCDVNKEIWDDKNDVIKNLCRKRGRKEHNICNIYVISDPMNKDNEGKVFLYDFGKTVLKKIVDVVKSDGKNLEEGEFFCDPSDFWTGANFKLVGHMDGKLRKYDQSKFLNPSPFLKGDDKAIEEVYNKLHPLAPFVAESNFKSYEDLKARFIKVQTPSGESPASNGIIDTDGSETVESVSAPKSAKTFFEDENL